MPNPTPLFLLSFDLYGGGGFFEHDLGANKIVQVVATLAFGIIATINLVLAHGLHKLLADFILR